MWRKIWWSLFTTGSGDSLHTGQPLEWIRPSSQVFSHRMVITPTLFTIFVCRAHRKQASADLKRTRRVTTDQLWWSLVALGWARTPGVFAGSWYQGIPCMLSKFSTQGFLGLRIHYLMIRNIRVPVRGIWQKKQLHAGAWVEDLDLSPCELWRHIIPGSHVKEIHSLIIPDDSQRQAYGIQIDWCWHW